MLEQIIGIILCVIIPAILGFLLGRHSLRPKGEIVFEPTYDENDQEGVKCTFKLDLDIDEIIAEDYILFGVTKDKRIKELYAKEHGK